MTNKELRELAERAKRGRDHVTYKTWNDYRDAANPKRIIELLDEVDRLRAGLDMAVNIANGSSEMKVMYGSKNIEKLKEIMNNEKPA